MDDGRVIGWVRGAIRFALFIYRRYEFDDASRMAAALAYTSLLSLVPLLVIALAMLAAFPVFDQMRGQIEAWAFSNFVPAVGVAVLTQVGEFVGNAGKLSAFGIVGLAFTSVTLLVTIEGSFNTVFRVAQARSAMSRLLVYWTVLTLGPLLIGGALSVQGYLTAIGGRLVPELVGWAKYLAVSLPTLLSALGFTVMLATVPNRRVRVADALAGGAAAALLFGALRWGFALYITSSQAYTNIYGAVAIVPIFLLWMFLSWAVVLVGAEITAALPEWRSGIAAVPARERQARRLALAVEILGLLQRRSLESGTGMSRRDLLQRVAVDERSFLAVLRRLVEAGLVAPTGGRHYLLARDLGSVTLWEVVAAMGLDLRLEAGVGAESPWRPAVAARIEAASEAAKSVLAVPLRPLVLPPKGE
jgi:membrane protein